MSADNAATEFSHLLPSEHQTTANQDVERDAASISDPSTSGEEQLILQVLDAPFNGN